MVASLCSYIDGGVEGLACSQPVVGCIRLCMEHRIVFCIQHLISSVVIFLCHSLCMLYIISYPCTVCLLYRAPVSGFVVRHFTYMVCMQRSFLSRKLKFPITCLAWSSEYYSPARSHVLDTFPSISHTHMQSSWGMFDSLLSQLRMPIQSRGSAIPVMVLGYAQHFLPYF